MGAYADKITAELLDRTERKFEEFGKLIADDLRELLSVPVGRNSSGRVIIRSKPGEAPRMETGRLRGSVQDVVYRAAGRVRLVVATHTPYARIVNRTRPYKAIMYKRWIGRLREYIKKP